MALRFAVVFSTAHFKNSHFIMTAVAHYGCCNTSASYNRRAYSHVITINDC